MTLDEGPRASGHRGSASSPELGQSLWPPVHWFPAPACSPESRQFLFIDGTSSSS